ncbi:MAG TPA: hypothetical protein VIG74_03870, partial [Alphaproteobacteria bacterium]
FLLMTVAASAGIGGIREAVFAPQDALAASEPLLKVAMGAFTGSVLSGASAAAAYGYETWRKVKNDARGCGFIGDF